MGLFIIIVIGFVLVGVAVCFLVVSKKTMDRSVSDKEQLEWIREYNKKNKRRG